MNDIIYTDATCIASDMTQNWLSLEHADKANCSNGPKVMSVWLCNEVSIFFQSLVKISKHCQIRLKNASGTRAFWTILVNEESRMLRWKMWNAGNKGRYSFKSFRLPFTAKLSNDVHIKILSWKKSIKSNHNNK